VRAISREEGNVKRLLLSLAVLLAAVPGGAAELVSPPLISLGGDDVSCGLTNGSSRTLDATVEFVDGNGSVLTTLDVTVAPGRPRYVTGPGGSTNPNFCRIRGSFSKRKVHAVYCVAAASNQGICVALE
jgi:hypothetical protein